MAYRSSGGAPQDNKKKFIYIGIIVACLGGAVLSYTIMSDNSHARTPAVKAAEARAQEIQTSVQEEQAKLPKQPPPSPIPPESHRGSMAPLK